MLLDSFSPVLSLMGRKIWTTGLYDAWTDFVQHYFLENLEDPGRRKLTSNRKQMKGKKKRETMDRTHYWFDTSLKIAIFPHVSFPLNFASVKLSWYESRNRKRKIHCCCNNEKTIFTILSNILTSV